MKNRKGFTLIELLAVIVILAIIMVIAVPQILKVIDNSRLQAAESSIALLKTGIQTQLAASEIQGGNPFSKNSEGCYEFDFDSKNSNYEALTIKNKNKFAGTLEYCPDTSAFDDSNLTFEGSNGKTEKRLYLYNKGTNNDMYERETSSTCGDTQYYHFNSNNLTINYVDQRGGCTGWAATWSEHTYDLSKYSKAVVEYSSVTITGDGKFALVVNNDYDTYSWLTQSATNGKLELDLTNCNITSEIAIVATTKPESGGFNNFSYGWIDQYRGDVDAVITAIYLVEK